MADFTKGKWTKYFTGDASWNIEGPDGWMIGEVMGRNKETDEANARLIAAAPEMYEALKELLKLVEDFGLAHPSASDAARWWPVLDSQRRARALVNKKTR